MRILFMWLACVAALACGGGSKRAATPRAVEASGRQTVTGCLSPDRRVFVLQDGVALDVASGDDLFTLSGRIVACDDAGVVLAKRSGGELEVRVRDYRTGADDLPPTRIALPECGSRGSIYYTAGPSDDAIQISFQVMAYWQGGYPPSPEEEADARCDERGGITIARDGSGGGPSRFIEWRMPRSAQPEGRLTASDGITLVQDLHVIEPCAVSDAPPLDSTLRAERDGEVLWTRVVTSPQSGPDCVP